MLGLFFIFSADFYCIQRLLLSLKSQIEFIRLLKKNMAYFS